MDVDLGQEYFVRGLDILWPAPYTTNVEVWGKTNADDEWIYIHSGDGQFVEPSKRRSHMRGYESLRGLDSVVRYVRWRATQPDCIYPQMDGIQEFWVWGEPKGAHASAEVKVFQPWFPDKAVPPENSVLFYLALRKAGVPSEMHIYERGNHGLGLAQKDPVLSTWPDRLADWLKNRGAIK